MTLEELSKLYNLSCLNAHHLLFPLRWKLFMVYLMSAGMSDHALFIPKNKGQVDEIMKYLNSR